MVWRSLQILVVLLAAAFARGPIRPKDGRGHGIDCGQLRHSGLPGLSAERHLFGNCSLPAQRNRTSQIDPFQ
jgi:hypothetical protein